MARGDAPVRLPEGSHLIHIGPQKTGSTALQAALHRSRDELADHGVIYPGPAEKPVRAVSAGLGIGMRRSHFTPKKAAWRDLLRQVHGDSEMRVCLSHEGFGRMSGDDPARVVAHLGGDRPHILAVARRLDDLMPSQWQQRIKAGKRWSYFDWLAIVLGTDTESKVWRNLWLGHDTVALVARWADVVGLENVTVLVSEPADRRQLLDVVEAMLGLPSGMLPQVDDQANRSLDFEEAELIRMVNGVFSRLPDRRDDDWNEFMNLGLVASIVHRRRTSTSQHAPFPTLPHWARQRLHELSEQRIDGLAGQGVRIVGDLNWLRVEPPTGSATEQQQETDRVSSVPMETAVAAVEGVLRRMTARRDGPHRPENDPLREEHD